MNEVLRQEKKFLISLDQYYKYRKNFGDILKEDKHSQGHGYLIRSLYFDSLDDVDFEEKDAGVEIRRKIRLRNYGPRTGFALLEMKQKHGLMQKKRSLKLSVEDAKRLINGDYSVLLKYKNPFAIESYAKMAMLLYRPKAVITYRRKAFVADENKIRITFDHRIRATESNFDIFSEDIVENNVLDPYMVVLEVKFNGFLPSYIKDMLVKIDTSETSVSKYCLGRTVSKHYLF